MLQQIIELVVILFLLSMISERIADFFKHYLCGSTFFGIGDTVTKAPVDTVAERARIYRILKINVWCGVLTAAVVKADLIQIFNNIEAPGETLGWTKKSMEPYADGGWLLLLPGLLFTGCFISFGSKFWHDLLDILYQIKNTKRILADPETYKADNIQALERIANTYESGFIMGAYAAARSEFMLKDNVRAISLKSGTDGAYYFEIIARNTDYEISSYYRYGIGNDASQSIPIQVIVLSPGDPIKAHSINLGSSIFSEDFPGRIGNIGCLVKPLASGASEKFILTCCHNVVHPPSNAANVRPGQIEVGLSGVPSAVGTVSSAIRDHEMDVALISITADNAANILNTVPKLGDLAGVRTLITEQDKNTSISLFGGAERGPQRGTVTSLSTAAKIEYEDRPFEIINMLSIQNNGQGITIEGDSGSVVLDDSNKVVGLVVGGNSTVSYVIPIEKMLKKLEVQLA